jgi:hypothetical protein
MGSHGKAAGAPIPMKPSGFSIANCFLIMTSRRWDYLAFPTAIRILPTDRDMPAISNTVHFPADPGSSGQQVLSLPATPFGRERLTLHQAGVRDYMLIVHLRKIGQIWICAESADFGVVRNGDGA